MRLPFPTIPNNPEFDYNTQFPLAPSVNYYIRAKNINFSRPQRVKEAIIYMKISNVF
jgi:hypothetical protein